MGSELAKTNGAALAPVQVWTPEQKELVKRTCAKDATDDELALFMHIASQSGLDPLRRQIHFMKYQGRVTIVADVNGLQARAAKEADFEGILHAVVYEKDEFVVDHVTGTVVKHVSNPLGNNGRIAGAWATVRRKGMLPFTAIVRMGEYDASNRNPIWKSMPAVMIDKCAKSTALRLAYPEQLGNIYDRAEVDRLEDQSPEQAPTSARAASVKAEVLQRAEVVEAKALPEPKPALPFDVAYETAKAQGVKWEEFCARVKQVTGKTKRPDVTEEDARSVLATFREPPADEFDASDAEQPAA